MEEEAIELLNEQIQTLVKDIKILQVLLLIMALILFAFLGILAKLGAQKLAEKLDLFEKKPKKESSPVKVIDSPKSSENNENHKNVHDEVNDSIIRKDIGVFSEEKDSDANAYVNNADDKNYPPIKPRDEQNGDSSV